MSLIPMIFSNWWEELDQPHSILDQHFGTGLHPDQLSITCSPYNRVTRQNALQPVYYRPWGHLFRRGDGGASMVKDDKDRFKVILDVQQFKPEEINVKVVDKCVVVEAKHEEKRDEHGWISRQFERKYLIPDQCEIDQVTSNLSSDGILTITAPRKEPAKVETSERQIKIEHTGKPAVKDAPPTKDKEVAENGSEKIETEAK